MDDTRGFDCNSSRDKRHAEVHSSPSSALRCSVESKRKSSVDHTGHLQGIVEASSSQEASAGLKSNSNGQPGRESAPENGASRGGREVAGAGNCPADEAAAPDQAASGAPEQAATGGTGRPEQATTTGGLSPPGEGMGGNAMVISLLQTSTTAVKRATGAVFGNGSEAHREGAEHANGEQSSGTDSRYGAQPQDTEGSRQHAVACNGTAEEATVDAASNKSEEGSETEAGREGGIGSKLKQLKNHLSLRDGNPDRKSEAGSGDDEEEGEKEKLHLPEDLKEKLKEKV